MKIDDKYKIKTDIQLKFTQVALIQILLPCIVHQIERKNFAKEGYLLIKFNSDLYF